jgi:hypothetical protein
VRLEAVPPSPAEARLLAMSARGLQFEAARVGVLCPHGATPRQFIAAILSGVATATAII